MVFNIIANLYEDAKNMREFILAKFQPILAMEEIMRKFRKMKYMLMDSMSYACN